MFQEKIDKMNIYIWKNNCQLVYRQNATFTKKKKSVPNHIRPMLILIEITAKRSQNIGETCERNDIVELLKLIRGFSCRHDQNNDWYNAVFNNLQAPFINFQKNDQTNDEYLKQFQTCMAILEDYNDNIVNLVSCLIEDTLKKLWYNNVPGRGRENKKAREYVFKRGLATLQLIGADCGCYGATKNQMQQNMMGINNHPKSVDETMIILNTFTKTNKSGIGNKSLLRNDNDTKVAFAQKDISDVTCYHCCKKEHFARTCSNKKSSNEAHVHIQMTNNLDNDHEKELGYIYDQNLMELAWNTC